MYFNNPAFYLDCAEYFLPINRKLSLQILSSVADLSFDSHFLYKSLAYYFKQYQSYKDMLHSTKKILELRPFEPHSYRDMAMAH